MTEVPCVNAGTRPYRSLATWSASAFGRSRSAGVPRAVPFSIPRIRRESVSKQAAGLENIALAIVVRKRSMARPRVCSSSRSRWRSAIALMGHLFLQAEPESGAGTAAVSGPPGLYRRPLPATSGTGGRPDPRCPDPVQPGGSGPESGQRGWAHDSPLRPVMRGRCRKQSRPDGTEASPARPAASWLAAISVQPAL